MHSTENKYRNVRVYKKRRQKNLNLQLSNTQSNQYRNALSKKSSRTNNNNQPVIVCSSSEQFDKNPYSLSAIEVLSIKHSTPRPSNIISNSMNSFDDNKKNRISYIFHNISTNSTSYKQNKNTSKLKRKTILKNLAFALFLILFVTALIVVPIVIVYHLSTATQSTETDPCKSSRTLTFDDIGANSLWIGSSGYGGMLPGYGGFVWSWANYVNVSANTVYGTALVSGGYVAYIDNTTPSNKLTITTNNSALFYICSMVVAAVSPTQTPLTVWGIYSNTTVYTLNVTINSTIATTLDFSIWKIGVDTIEMYAYGNIFAFDNLVMSGP